jgi:two-component system sensor histidine kinase DesK
LFVLPLLYAVPRGRAIWARHRGGLLVTQAVLTFVPFAIFGRHWSALFSGLLGGLVLLAMKAPVSWILAAVAVAVEGALRIALPVSGQPLALTAWTFTVSVNTAVTLFGLVRLADLISDLYETRAELATLAVRHHRVRSADLLSRAIGDRLETIAAHVRTALPMVATSPAEARTQLVEAASVARQALEQVRMTVSGDDRNDEPTGPGRTGDTVAPQVARLVLLAIFCAFLAQLLLNVLAAGTDHAGAAAVIVTVLGLQLYHSLARRDGVRPRGWQWTLSAQTLGVASFWAFDEVTILGLAGFTAGSVLLLFPGRWAWTVLGAAAGGVGLITAVHSAYGVFDGVYVAASTAGTGLVVYGLTRLTDLADRVGMARHKLARMAVVEERLRVARDTHDLLGLGLSAVALKCDLAVRLISRDNNRARRELTQLLTIAANALSDLRSVTGEADHYRSMRTELAAARDALDSAGVKFRADVPDAPVPVRVDEVLATVLREAVTNILRHSTAEWCTIRLSGTAQVLRLRVVNDGAHKPGVSNGGGTGLNNLRERIASLNGHLDAGAYGVDLFELAVELPVTPTIAVGVSRYEVLGGDLKC